MNTRARRHSVKPKNGTRKGLERYDGSRFAVFIPQLGGRPVFGAARFERDDVLGNVLRIAVEGSDPGSPEILIAEKEWNGLITEDRRYGCDFTVAFIAGGD